MTNYYYTIFMVFCIIVVMIVIDQNVGDYILLTSRLITNNFRRTFWMIRFHPFWIRNPIGQWWAMKRHMRTAEELAQELSKKHQDGV